MHCKSLWIKASAKCINVNVIVKINIYIFKRFDATNLPNLFRPFQMLQTVPNLLNMTNQISSLIPGNYVKPANQIRACQIQKLLPGLCRVCVDWVQHEQMFNNIPVEPHTNSIFICVPDRCVFHRHPVVCVEGDDHHSGQTVCRSTSSNTCAGASLLPATPNWPPEPFTAPQTSLKLLQRQVWESTRC